MSFDYSDIHQRNWKPQGDLFDYSTEFVDWIDSINVNFSSRTSYEPLRAYVAQSQKWLQDKDVYDDYKDDAINAERFRTREIMRCRANSLYHLDKNLWIIEGAADSGRIPYKAYAPQEIIAFLFDCAYNMFLGKGRQIFFTTTMGGLALGKIAFRRGYQILYMAEEKAKAEQLYREKIAWPARQLPENIRAQIRHLGMSKLYFGADPKNPRQEGNDSYIEILAPRSGKAAGFSANLVLLDEIGLNPQASVVLDDIMPAMFRFDPDTGKLKMSRQMVGWGTGGDMKKGGAVFKKEWEIAEKAWRNGEHKHGIIPIFFDYMARQGMTKKLYIDLEKKAYSYVGPDREEKITKFHQAYPKRKEDMFITGQNTMLPGDKINTHLDRIYALGDNYPQYGYFEPIKDDNGKITGVNWVSVENIKNATTIICKHPEKGWKNRYYPGTDPINAASGPSKFSKSIWDNYEPGLSAVLFHRSRDYEYTFEQSILLSLYYEADKELLEINAGELYKKYLEDNGFGRWLVPNIALPPYLRTPSVLIGIYNSGSGEGGGTARYIANKIIEMLASYADVINIPEFYLQLLTFVEKTSKTGHVKWECDDKRYRQDDIIFSTVFAYINAVIHTKYFPKKLSEGDQSPATTKTYYDSNWNLKVGKFTSDGKLITRQRRR